MNEKKENENFGGGTQKSSQFAIRLKYAEWGLIWQEKIIYIYSFKKTVIEIILRKIVRQWFSQQISQFSEELGTDFVTLDCSSSGVVVMYKDADEVSITLKRKIN